MAGVALALAALAGCATRGAGGADHARVEVTTAGFVPAQVPVRRGHALVITFERTADRTCGTDVVFPTLHRGFDLPLNHEVPVALSTTEIGDTLRFSCSMDMLHGMVVAK
jgi:plastocyanin domain-containing protein